MAFEDLQEGDTTASLGNLCLCSVTCTVNKLFLIIRWSSLCVSFCPLPGSVLFAHSLHHFQSFHHLVGPLLDSFQYGHVSLLLGSHRTGHSPPGTALPMPIRGEGSPLLTAGYTLPNTTQDTISFLSGKGSLLAHVQLSVQQEPQVLFCQAAFRLGGPQHLPVTRVGVGVLPRCKTLPQ